MEIKVSELMKKETFQNRMNEIEQYMALLGMNETKQTIEIVNDIGEWGQWLDGGLIEIRGGIYKYYLEASEIIRTSKVFIPIGLYNGYRIMCEGVNEVICGEKLYTSSMYISGRVKTMYVNIDEMTSFENIIAVKNLKIVSEDNIITGWRRISKVVSRGYTCVESSKPIIPGSDYTYRTINNRIVRYRVDSFGRAFVGNGRPQGITDNILVQNAYKEFMNNMKGNGVSIKINRSLKMPEIEKVE